MVGDEKWRAWVGRVGDDVPGPYPVSVAAIGYAAEAVEDAELLERIAAGEEVVAPPTFVTPASRVPNWRPPGASGPSSFMQALAVPVASDAAVNLSVDQTYGVPLHPGDRVRSRSTITAIEPRTTRLGDGLVITEEIVHRNHRDEVVARTTNSMYRYVRPLDSRAPRAARSASSEDEPGAGASLPTICLPITMTTLVVAAGGLRDFSPIHHDVDAARAAGHPTAFASFSFQQALIGRLVKDWFGPAIELHRLALTMRLPVYVGRQLSCSATMRERPHDGSSNIILDVLLATEDGRCASAQVEIATPAER